MPRVIDWLTLRLAPDLVPADVRTALERLHSWRVTVDPDGEVTARSPIRERLRSDSHVVTVLCGYDLELSGSPARCGAPNNVFGPRSPREGAQAMIDHVARSCGVVLPPVEQWTCTRIDVTTNHVMRNAAEVAQALSYLRQTGGGHFQVRSKGETVYWNPASKWRAGKAYHKGQHLRYAIQKGIAEATDEEVSLADRLLRLELTIRSEWIRERAPGPWWSLSSEDVEAMQMSYFDQFLTAEIADPGLSDIERCERAACELYAGKNTGTPGAGRAAYRTYLLARQVGMEQARDMVPRSTWARHRKILNAAGISIAEIRGAQVIPLRRRALYLAPAVHSWDELRRVAA